MAMKQAVETALEELAAVKECLAGAGIVTDERFLTVLHRRRFASVRKNFPCTCESSALDVFGDADVMYRAIQFAEQSDLVALKTTTPAVHSSAERAESSNCTQKCIFACGGSSGSENSCLDAAERFDPVKGEWVSLPPMLSRRFHAVSGCISQRVYVCGGTSRDSIFPPTTYTKTADVFNTDSQRWVALPPMSDARGRAVGEVIGGRLYVCGGSSDQNCPDLKSAECFDPKRGKWELLSPMLTARTDAMSGVINGVLYVAGGACKQGKIAATERFHPSENRWEALPSMAASSDALCCAISDRLYVCGGVSSEMKDDIDILNLTIAERFDSERCAWELLPPLVLPLNRYTAVSAAIDGSLYVFGCCLEERQQCVAQRFDADCGHWEALTPQPTKRLSALSAAIDGRFYVFGGHDVDQLCSGRDSGDHVEWGRGVLDSAECFDPGTNAWISLPPMHSRRTLLGRAGTGPLVFMAAKNVE
eukprot:CAMPEP_0169183998 /NCGR_PEP_ID=MMETSP1016-20121227/980_1 /TAXON_ID=342587 /ORGANISM="Karlodinium micrum, Strain CCMP2283" /LENGTH=476 /DNA_ID=CAMNT_0009259509 /DNA_START=15 /DNA_END=1445 /DNA_ORIENTATION=-